MSEEEIDKIRASINEMLQKEIRKVGSEEKYWFINAKNRFTDDLIKLEEKYNVDCSTCKRKGRGASSYWSCRHCMVGRNGFHFNWIKDDGGRKVW